MTDDEYFLGKGKAKVIKKLYSCQAAFTHINVQEKLNGLLLCTFIPTFSLHNMSMHDNLKQAELHRLITVFSKIIIKKYARPL